MAETMKSLLIHLFINNWQRKLVSVILAVVLWLVINHSMTVTKTIHNIPVKIIHLNAERTIDGMGANHVLNQRVSLVLTGNKAAFEQLTGSDIMVVVDVNGKGDEWVETIGKNNLVCLNPNLDEKHISSVMPYELVMRQNRMVTEKIMVLVTPPIGEPPHGYQYLDIWPYQLQQTIRGPESVVKELKARGCKLTFNLDDISEKDLSHLNASVDAVSFLVPNAWKKISIPQLSESLIEIDDPQADHLRIDFSKEDLLLIDAAVPISVYFPPKYSSTLNPEIYQIAVNNFIVKKNGMKIISTPLYAKGVSRLFLETVRDMIQLVVIASPVSEKEQLEWHVQFMYSQELEDRYVAKAMAIWNDAREELLRNRFRHYVNSFRLFTPNGKKLGLKIELRSKAICINPVNLEQPAPMPAKP
jgi:hypothetical protein